MVRTGRKKFSLLGLLIFLWYWEGCAPNMSNQPRYKPLAPSSFFPDGRSARPAVPGAVQHEDVRSNPAIITGRVDGEAIKRVPLPITRELLERGRARFDIFCSPCHGRTGTGHGMVVKRGFRQPPSYHIERLKEAPDGHFFIVITDGFGEMAGYADRVPIADRWAITAYIRALQYSQAAALDDVPPTERRKMFGSEK